MTTEIDHRRADPLEEAIRTARSLRQRAHSAVGSLEEAQSLLATCETLRRPVAKDWLMGRVATLLSHFYVSSTDEAEMRAALSDWADALSEFPAWVIAEACREYLRTQERKPSIAAIRKLCQQHFAVVEFTRMKAMRGPQESERPSMSEADRAAMRARMAEAGDELVEKMRAKLEGTA